MSRKRGVAETAEYVSFARRAVRALGRRLHGATPEEFRAIVEVYQEFDDMLAEAVQAFVAADRDLGPNQRTQTWAAVGRMFGISRQAAEQRWSPEGRERKRRLQREWQARQTSRSASPG